MSGFDIAGKRVGDGSPCFIVGEVAQGHHGSYDLAHSFIDAIADAGADAVKFQRHVAEAESWPDEPWRVKPRWGNETRFEYWKRMEFTHTRWRELKKHARERGLAFIASPFSLEALDLIETARVSAVKVASGQITDSVLLHRMRGLYVPLILSTGMCTSAELDAAIEWLTYSETQEPPKGRGPNDKPLVTVREVRCERWPVPLALLQCTSAYPCPPDRLGLNNLATLRERYGVPVGLSDHSGTVYAGLAAVALGCDILEVHVKLSDYDPGPDASSSITVPQLRQLVEGVRFIEKAKQPVDKDRMAEELKDMRELFMNRHKRKAEQPRDINIYTVTRTSHEITEG